MVYAGAVMLLCGYAGSRFVLEVLLARCMSQDLAGHAGAAGGRCAVAQAP